MKTINRCFYIVVVALATCPVADASFDVLGVRVDTDPKHWTPPPPSEIGGNIHNTLTKAGGDIHGTLMKAEHDFHNTAATAGGDTEATLKKAVSDTADAGKAVGRFVNREAIDIPNNISKSADKAIRGRTFDGLWELGTAPLKSTDENAGKVVRESPLLNTVGQVAATVYGGPGGAAAYAAWSTLKLTGDPGLAFRAGIISGVAAGAMQGVGTMPNGTGPEIARKAVVAGAIGGLAVAASQGDSHDVKKAFLLGAGMVVVQAGYEKFTSQKFDPRSQVATDEGHCMLSTGADCSPPNHMLVKDSHGILYGDPSKMQPGDKVVNYVSFQVDKDSTSGWKYWVGERSPVVTNVLGRTPPWNTMAIAHDHLVIVYHLSTAASLATIPPAIVLTYAGTGAGIYSGIQSAVVGSAKGTPVAAAKTPLTSADRSSAIICNRPDKPEVLSEIVVTIPAETSGLACQVTYKDQDDVRHLWSFKHDRQFCLDKARATTAVLMSQGWACLTP